MSQKKCPNCEKWSVWTTSYDDRCEHCGELLSPVEVERKVKQKQEEKRQEEEWMFYIKPDDTFFQKFFKKTGNFFYVIFMGIMTFIMWMIAAMPG